MSDKQRYEAVTIEDGLACIIISVRGDDHDDAKREICHALYRPKEPHRLNLFTRWKMGGEMVLMPGGIIWDNKGREWWQHDNGWVLYEPEPEPEPLQAVCYSAHDVGSEVGGINGWPVNEHGEPYWDITLALEEIPF